MLLNEDFQNTFTRKMELSWTSHLVGLQFNFCFKLLFSVIGVNKYGKSNKALVEWSTKIIIIWIIVPTEGAFKIETQLIILLTQICFEVGLNFSFVNLFQNCFWYLRPLTVYDIDLICKHLIEIRFQLKIGKSYGYLQN